MRPSGLPSGYGFMANDRSVHATPAPLMALDQVTMRFGAVTALNDLSFDIRPGEIFGIAGPNGAGKSTLLNVCAGMLKPSSGAIRFDGTRVDGMKPHRLCRLGIARIFQIPQVFASLSVYENARTGALFGGKARGVPADRRTVEAALDLTGILDRADQPVATADLMTRKLTMLSAALATNPRVLFMDEPLAGLNPAEIDGFADLILDLHRSLDLSIVVVEHKVRALKRLSDRILILNFGSLLCIGDPETVMRDPKVIESYLGNTHVA